MCATAVCHAECVAPLPQVAPTRPRGPYLLAFVPLAPLLSWLPDLSLWEHVDLLGRTLDPCE